MRSNAKDGRAKDRNFDAIDDSRPETVLTNRDPLLGLVINSQPDRWPLKPTEDPIWGLIRIVVAQQIATELACRIIDRIKSSHPGITAPTPDLTFEVRTLRMFGLPERRAHCCVEISRRSDQLRSKVRHGETWEEALADIKGIGPWTISVFRIMVLRDQDVLPVGDIGLERAVTNVYGRDQDVAHLAKQWRPFRSVACWYLWRSLGNQQLG